MPRWADHKGKILQLVGGSLTIFPKDLNIPLGDDSRYWTVPSDNDGAAELKQIWWLEVSGIARVEQKKKYRVEFEVEVKQAGSDWNNIPVRVMAKAGRRGTYKYQEVTLSTNKKTIPTEGSGALVIEMNSEDLLHFGLYEMWTLKRKSGLVIHKAVISEVT